MKWDNLCGPHGPCLLLLSPLSCSPVLTPSSGLGSFQRTEMGRKGGAEASMGVLCWTAGSGPEALVGAPFGNTSTAKCLPGIQPLATTLPPHEREQESASAGKYLSAGVFFYWARSMATRATRRAEQAGSNHGPLKTKVTFCQQAPGPRTRSPYSLQSGFCELSLNKATAWKPITRAGNTAKH